MAKSKKRPKAVAKQRRERRARQTPAAPAPWAPIFGFEDAAFNPEATAALVARGWRSFGDAVIGDSWEWTPSTPPMPDDEGAPSMLATGAYPTEQGHLVVELAGSDQRDPARKLTYASLDDLLVDLDQIEAYRAGDVWATK